MEENQLAARRAEDADRQHEEDETGPETEQRKKERAGRDTDPLKEERHGTEAEVQPCPLQGREPTESSRWHRRTVPFVQLVKRVKHTTFHLTV